MKSSPRWVRWMLALALFAGVGTGIRYVHAQANRTPAVETLLPSGAIAYFDWDGMQAHDEAWKKTAAYRSLHESGLMDVVAKLLRFALQQAQAQEPGIATADLEKAYTLITDNGLSLAVSLPGEDGAAAPMPFATLVLHKGAPLEPGLSAAIKQGTQGELDLRSQTLDGRKVTSALIPDSPGVEVGWWLEGEHLVAVVGIDAVKQQIDVAAGRTPNITANPLWKKYRAEEPGFERSLLGWFDFGELRTRFGGIPLPPTGPDAPQVTANQVLDALGLGNLGALVTRSGYKGEASWSKTTLEAPGEKKGLLALGSTKPISLDDVPPLPPELFGFATGSIDWSHCYVTLTKVVKDVTALGPPQQAAQVEGMIDQLPAMLGVDVKTDLLDPLGGTATIYSDLAGGVFGAGVVLAVDDAAKLRTTLDNLLARASQEAGPNEFQARRVQKHGREMVVLEIGGGMFSPTYVVDEKWLAIGLLPQTVESFLLRVDDKLPRWKPEGDWENAMKELPREFTSISGSDPRPVYRGLLGYAPWIMGFLQGGLRQSGMLPPGQDLPVTVADLPPADVVVRHLFPNVSVSTVDDEGFHWTSRSSLPSNPLLSGGGSAGVATSGVLIALLLPAVQAAREAARRSNSASNLKNHALALHNHHDAFRGLPAPAYPNEDLKPEQRLSWMTRMLPFLDEQPVYNRIDFKKAWDDEANKEPLSKQIGVLLHPSLDEKEKNGYGVTHYVGVSGYGEDPTKNPGVFGSERGVRFADITDGLTNTLLMIEVNKDFGPWGASGKSTVRGFTKKPYFNGPDGIGGPSPLGAQAAAAAGAVHFIDNDTDPSVFEALSTRAGGEV
ncbi:MAG: DUF1559 domain-containing protein, partial [Planctomycetaceae bacterium]